MRRVARDLLRVYTVIDEETHERLRTGQPVEGMVATFFDPNAAENWWPRAMTGTIEDMWEWLRGHDVEEAELEVPIPYIHGGYARWGDRWRLTPAQVISMFELSRVPAECLG